MHSIAIRPATCRLTVCYQKFHSQHKSIKKNNIISDKAFNPKTSRHVLLQSRHFLQTSEHTGAKVGTNNRYTTSPTKSAASDDVKVSSVVHPDRPTDKPSDEESYDSESEDEEQEGSGSLDDEAPSTDESTKPPATFNDSAVRVSAGVILGAIGGATVFLGGWWFASVVALVSYQCIAEYYGFLKGMGTKTIPLPLRNTAGLCCLAVVLGTQWGIRSGLFEVAIFVLISMLVLVRREKKRIRFSQITSLVFGLFYCGYLPSFWVRVRALGIPATITLPSFLPAFFNMFTATSTAAASAATEGISSAFTQVTVDAGMLCTFLPVLCIVAADTFAYLGGRKFGKTPLIRISPKKTVEGAMCGLLGSILVALFWNACTGWPGSQLAAVLLGAVTFTASIFGDLIESSMKREAGLKDSGDVIPGHGGLLDRFDSYIFTGVLVYFFWYWYFYFVMGKTLTPLRPIIPSWVY